ncbi:hypothetical protein [Pleionea litopenaei]|uniref:Uncharacterized protein n=1 Tax=Pleionea litopenaei TaxID=3070815 RepID=A0AA51RTS0_9GAMM|nr:hypothetical protein [Pleionea sp. HL-JVS1]WMS87435.1 hypothetical protein Q9312_00555 [Pleionea sp. HL-JVS1]
MHKGLVSAIFAVTASVTYAGSPEDCTQVSNDEKRLACYDAFFKVSTQAKKTKADLPKAPTPVVPDSTAASQPAKPAEPSAPLPKSDANQPVKTSEVASTKDTQSQREDYFGLENKMAEENGDTLQAKIVGKFSRWKKGMEITLDNGQVWEVISSRSLYHKVTDPKVVIERGAFGAFFLGFDDINTRLKVKRVK